MGRRGVAADTPHGFRVELAGSSSFTIGPGRMYVGGLLAECRGGAPIPYEEQPYLDPAPALPPTPGTHLVYLDVWERGVQTVWQARVLPTVGDAVTCTTPDDDIPGWRDATRSSAGRLSTSAIAGFRGEENQLYRVEIHQGGPTGAATFKWSRGNAPVVARVLGISSGRDELTVERAERDAVRRFSAGDWVEVTDERRGLAGEPGEMRRVARVDEARSTIELASALPAGAFDATAPERRTRLRRWDQKGTVLDPAGNTLVDVEASGGTIPISVSGFAFVLESGVVATLTLDPAGGEFRTGDHWVFAAPTTDGSVEELVDSPPLAVHHHYSRLALVTLGENVTDCRASDEAAATPRPPPAPPAA